MRNRIWTELTQAKYNIEFTSLYSEKQRTILRLYNIGIVAFSSAGIMGWKVWEHLPLTACIIIALVSLLKLIQPQIIMNDKQLQNLNKIYLFYSSYYNDLEKLWYDFEDNRLTEQEATNNFFELKEKENEISPIIAETIRYKPKRLLKRCKINCDNYFNQVFNT